MRIRFNPHAPRGARPYHPEALGESPNTLVSIRTPREGRDSMRPQWLISPTDLVVSIRTPREGRDVDGDFVRAAGVAAHVSIRTPREGRDNGKTKAAYSSRSCFNPHAPRGARLGACDVSAEP